MIYTENQKTLISFSKLETYLSCARLFKNKHIDKIPAPKTVNESLFMGSCVHKILEERIKDKAAVPHEIFTYNLPVWLEEIGIVNYQEILDTVAEIAQKLAHLLYRASSQCKEEDYPIRNANGTPLKDPFNYPSGSFTAELKAANLHQDKYYLDLPYQGLPIFTEGGTLSKLFAEIYLFGCYSQLPKWAAETLGTEYVFSDSEDNLVELPGQQNTYFYGIIDWIVKLPDGRIAIIDHKTSKKKPSQQEVFLHSQLNIYAFAYKQIFGKYPDIIGIHHIRSGEFVLAQTKEEIILEQVNYAVELYQTLQQEQAYTRKRPTDYNTPCLKRDYKTDKVTAVCPYLGLCWPNHNHLLVI